jgi:hypothetical protein
MSRKRVLAEGPQVFQELMSLPLPTLEQTERFAQHVADNHSWYKHLPFFPPGASFVVFPNPQAGRGVRADGDRFVVYDVEQGNYFKHHSRVPTAEYLALFGYWDYWVDDNPRVYPEPGPWLYGAEGGRELLPEDLKRQWSCRLTAFLKPMFSMFRLRTYELKREAAAFRASDPWRLGRLLRGLFARARGRQITDTTDERYRQVAAEMSEAAGSEGTPSLFRFAESEAAAQRSILLDALHRVRAAWSDAQAGNAEAGAAADRNGL